jgi:hypothetical protein
LAVVFAGWVVGGMFILCGAIGCEIGCEIGLFGLICFDVFAG